MEVSEKGGANSLKIDTNTVILVIAIIGGTIAADSRYVDTMEADRKYQSKSDAERFMRNAQDLHTLQSASILELRARELGRLHSVTENPELKKDIQGEIDMTAMKLASLSVQFNKTYEVTMGRSSH